MLTVKPGIGHVTLNNTRCQYRTSRSQCVGLDLGLRRAGNVRNMEARSSAAQLFFFIIIII
eukprot:2272871-Rhodomonas_salina.2